MLRHLRILSRPVLFLATGALVAGVATPAGAQSLSLLDVKSQQAADIRIDAADGSARVIFMLVPQSGTARSAAQADIDDRVAAVASAVDAVLADHFGSGFSTQSGTTRGLVRAAAHPVFAANLSLAEIDALAADPRVASVSADGTFEANLADSIPLIGMPAAYTNSQATGAGYAVAVLDTGVDHTHPWFTGALLAEACFSGGGTPARSFCPGQALSDTTTAGAGRECTGYSDCFHGTHVAGIAVGDNTTVAGPPNGVARQGGLLAYQVFTAGATPGGRATAFFSDVLAALSDIYARRATFGVPLAAINLSLGSNLTTYDCDTFQPAWTTVLGDLKAAGIATVIATGNDGHPNAVSFPACITEAVSVASSTKTDTVSSFSNNGPMTDLFAPGSSITSTTPGNTFTVASGTSMATPHVAGAFAALRSHCTAITADATGVDAILQSLVDTGTMIDDLFTDRPRINVDDAAIALCGGPAAPANNDAVNAFVIASGGNAAQPTLGANKEFGEPFHAGNAGGVSVWYRFAPTAAYDVTIDTGGSGFDTLLAVYGGTNLNNVTLTAENDDVGGGDTTSRVTFRTVVGRFYFIALDGKDGAAGNVRLAVSAVPPAPPPPPGTTPTPAPTCTLAANPVEFDKGGQVELSWTSTNATELTISEGVGPQQSIGTGAVIVSPKVPTIYAANFTGPGGSVACGVLVMAANTGAFDPRSLLVLLGVAGAGWLTRRRKA